MRQHGGEAVIPVQVPRVEVALGHGEAMLAQYMLGKRLQLADSKSVRHATLTRVGPSVDLDE